ncbi:MAG: collagen-like protein [Chloroflexi bacterium]|nr:collagen-like protein [Chloroflexota bacterium]
MRIRFPSKGMTLALFFSVFSVLVLVGCRGPQGNAGLPGAAGNPGNAGLQGQAGEPGLSGFPGEPGNVGSQGIQGVQGIQGEQGSPGVSPEAQIMLSESTLTLDEPLQVWGSGFLPGEPVTLLLVVDAINNWVVGGSFDDRPVANASGAFAMSLDSIRGSISGSTIGSKAPGIRSIVAMGDDGSRASAPVRITEATPSRTAPSTSLSANPTTVNGDVTVWGAGFMPDEFVSITILSAVDGIDKLLTGGPANESGAFVFPATEDTVISLAVGDDETPIAAGVYTIIALGDQGSEATAPLLILSDK